MDAQWPRPMPSDLHTVSPALLTRPPILNFEPLNKPHPSYPRPTTPHCSLGKCDRVQKTKPHQQPPRQVLVSLSRHPFPSLHALFAHCEAFVAPSSWTARRRSFLLYLSVSCFPPGKPLPHHLFSVAGSSLCCAPTSTFAQPCFARSLCFSAHAKALLSSLFITNMQSLLL